jgi:hypothetical protein
LRIFISQTEEFNQLLEESDDIHRRRQEASEMLKVLKTHPFQPSIHHAINFGVWALSASFPGHTSVSKIVALIFFPYLILGSTESRSNNWRGERFPTMVKRRPVVLGYNLTINVQ